MDKLLISKEIECAARFSFRLVSFCSPGQVLTKHVKQIKIKIVKHKN